jgi:3,4-dihydroxy-2-butanone 4-phosphate synthase
MEFILSSHILLAYNNYTVGVVCSTMTIQKLEKLGAEVVVFEKTKERPISFRVICDKHLCNATGIDYKTLKSLVSITE